MHRLGVTSLILVAAVASGWWLFSSRSKEQAAASDETQVLGANSPSTERGPEIPRGDFANISAVSAEAASEVGVVRGPLADEADSALRTWPDLPGVMESLILVELSNVPDSGISSIDSWGCTPTLCEVRYISTKSLSVLIGADSSFSRRFGGAPYNAYIRVKSRLIAPGTWERTISLRSNGDTEQRLNEEWRHAADWQQAAVLPRRTVDSVKSLSTSRMSLVVGTTYEGTSIVGQNACSYSCPGDSPVLLYLRVPNGKTCTQLNGTEQAITVRTDSGQGRQETYCLPNFVIEY